jgi:hypothetical protein
MDEAKAEPPVVSVVIPVFNGGDDLEQCLAAVFASDFGRFECIVVDDASTDGRTAGIARRYGARLLEMDRQRGPAIARNRGAEAARGEVLFFTDADVVLHPNAISRAVETLRSDAGLAAVFGSYDASPKHSSFVSRYRNLYHHWNHQLGQEDASTFWTGCGAVRRNIFLQLDGFSNDYERPSIEDIELGYRIRSAGYRIRLVKDMLASHLKCWTFMGMVKTDIFQRGIPWVVLLRRFPDSPADLNINPGARAATLLALIFLCSLVAAAGMVWAGWSAWWFSIPVLCIAGITWIQRDFLRLLWKLHGPASAFAAIPLQVVFFICCAVAVPLGYLEAWREKRPRQSRPR